MNPTLLAEQVNVWRCRPELAYAVRMWDFVLQAADLPDAALSHDENCDALPYLPINPAHYGLRLDGHARLLDIGCLAGYGLFDMALRLHRRKVELPYMVGADVDAASLRMGRDMADRWARDLGARVEFVQMDATALDFADGYFSIIMARLVFNYTGVHAALTAASRVLRNGGLLVAQVHSPRYYIRQWTRARTLRSRCYYPRPLLSWLFLLSLGRQFRRRGKWRETAISLAWLRREARSAGLLPLAVMGYAAKPLLVLQRAAGPFDMNAN